MKANEKIGSGERQFRQGNLSEAATRVHKKLPNEPICHFSKVPIYEPLAYFPGSSRRSNEPIFSIKGDEFAGLPPQKPLIPLNPGKFDQKKNSLLTANVQIEASCHCESAASVLETFTKIWLVKSPFFYDCMARFEKEY